MVDRDQREFLLTLANQSGLAIENANLYARTLQLSITDGLTGLFNYRHFCERLELESPARAATTRRSAVADRHRSLQDFNDRFATCSATRCSRPLRTGSLQTRDIDLVARYGVRNSASSFRRSARMKSKPTRSASAWPWPHAEMPGGENLGVTVSIGGR